MTDTTAPDAITQARAAEMLALAPLQPAQPPKDRVFYARQHVPMKWTPYKPTSQEVKRGKKGRWQQRRAYGLGWENADEEPQAGAWIEDVINHPDRRLAAHGAGEGLRERAAWRFVLGIAEQQSGTKADLITGLRLIADQANRSLTPPTDAGSTTREGGEGVREVRRNPADPDWESCPACTTGQLDTGFECNSCGFDAEPLVHLQEACEASGDRMHPSGLYSREIAHPAIYAPSIPLATTSSPDASPDSGEHPDDLAVDRFAAKMKAKLARAREKGRGGWDDPEQCSPDVLSRMLHDHVAKGDPVDVANFAMMIEHYGASISPEAR